MAKMEKAMGTPSNVMIYKQHWDYDFKAPALLEKLPRTPAGERGPCLPPWTQTGLALSRLARVLLLSIILAKVGGVVSGIGQQGVEMMRDPHETPHDFM